MKIRLLFVLSIWTYFSYGQWEKEATAQVPQATLALTNVMFHDVVNPPAAARFYSYCLLSAYEASCELNDQLPRFQKNFKNYPSIANRFDKKNLLKDFASLYCLLETGKNILPSGYLLEEQEKSLYNTYRKKYKKAQVDSSVAFAKYISAALVKYSRSDGYFSLSTYDRYKLKNTDSTWTPTPPEYMAAVEPYWFTMRTFFLDSAKQFRSLPPIAFSSQKNTAFFALMKEVYDTGKNLTKEQSDVANFWDCNPFAVQFAGHMSVGLKKISPGGHWMGITGIASKKAKLSLEQSIMLHTLVALSLHDAFISCWTEKYECHRIRPETAINRYMDQAWKPLLQTPPFPEYTSGHSVISTTAAEVLTSFLGDKFSFIDSTETYIGLPPRKFSSFKQAADEACISRLYGGIHFRDAIENGREQGERIGKYIIRKLNLPAL